MAAVKLSPKKQGRFSVADYRRETPGLCACVVPEGTKEKGACIHAPLKGKTKKKKKFPEKSEPGIRIFASSSSVYCVCVRTCECVYV